ncbi:MAG: site-2 protease family protein [Clostridia bacterium]|nr:site-2 protease family protein [Clostridia bacterium]
MNILNNLMSLLQDALYLLPISLLSLTVHEFAHGYTAYKLGDPTAKEQGRLTFNPIKHIDPIGFIMMVIFRVGYAKPVPVNPLYFKKPKLGMLITAAAGPLSNLAIAVFCSFFSVLFAVLSVELPTNAALDVVFTVFFLTTLLNLSLFVFNLIPVHPFDGSRILGYFLPNSYHNFIHKYGTYIYIAFFVFLIATDYVETVISTVQIFLYNCLMLIWYVPVSALVNLFI